MITERYNAVRPRRRAFTLLELLAVVTILGVVVAVIVPRISLTGVSAKKEMCTQHVTEVNRALERYFVENGSYASQVNVLSAPEFFPNGVPVCPLLNSSYEIDGVTKRLKPCNCTL